MILVIATVAIAAIMLINLNKTLYADQVRTTAALKAQGSQAAQIKKDRDAQDQKLQQQINDLRSKVQARDNARQAQLNAVAAVRAVTVAYKAPVIVKAYDSSILTKIMYCESGGRPDATNGTHFGLFQFDIATWNSYGPHVTTGAEIMAMPVATQMAAAQAAFAIRGVNPWVASEHCWG